MSIEQAQRSDFVLTLNPHVVVHVCGPDEILIKHGGNSAQSTLVADEQRRGLLADLMTAIGTPISIGALAKQVETDESLVEEILGPLLDAQLVVDARSGDSGAYVALRFGREQLDEIAKGRVSVAGDGRIAELVHQELGELAPESVELVRIEPLADDPAAIVEGVDHLVVALDRFSPSFLHAVNSAALAARVPWTCAYVDGSHVYVGPSFGPLGGPCYAETELQLESGIRFPAENDAYKRTLDADGRRGALPPGVALLAAGLLVTILQETLATGTSPIDGRCVVVDTERAAVDVAEVWRLPRCPTCSDAEMHRTFAP